MNRNLDAATLAEFHFLLHGPELFSSQLSPIPDSLDALSAIRTGRILRLSLASFSRVYSSHRRFDNERLR